MKYSITIVFVICVLSYLLFADTTKINPDEYIVKAGDSFLIQNILADTLVINSVVLPAGCLSLHPFADTVHIAGKTLTEAYGAINRKIGNDVFRDKVLIQLNKIAPIRFHIMGAVSFTGEYITTDVVSLHQALILCGGISASASKEINILRNNQKLTYDLNKYYADSDITVNPLIMQDDIIVVNFAINSVKVYTNVGSSNIIESVELKNDRTKISDIILYLTKKHGFSNYNKFTIERDGEYTFVDKNYILQPDDNLYILNDELFVFVTGFVNYPGKHAYNGSLDIRYYLSQSGGPNTNGARNKIFILDQNGKQKLYKGQEIRPGDIIYVPESTRSKIIVWLIPISTVVTILSTIIYLTR